MLTKEKACWLDYKIVIGSQKKDVKFNLSTLVYKLKPIHPKNQKQIMHESNKLCIIQSETKSH